MAVVRKPFSPTLFKENDDAARKAVKKLFKGSDYKLELSQNKFTVDFFVFNKAGDHVANIECEIKRVWKSEKFPYPSVQIPARKEKYAKLAQPTFYFMFNDTLKHYLVIKGEDLLASPKVEVHNKYVRAGELFFQVPASKVFFDLIPEMEIENEKAKTDQSN